MNAHSFSAEQGRRIRLARMDARRTQEEAGAAVGKSAATIGRWERGSASPTTKELYTLSRFLKVPLRRVALVDDGEYIDVADLPPDLQGLLKAHVDGLTQWVRGVERRA